MSGRFIIEGEWTGYSSGQRRIVHRTVHQGNCRKLRAWAEKTHGITYTDGTQLLLTVHDCKPRERVQTLNGYGSLIVDCAYYGVSSVEELQRAKEAARAAYLQETTE